MYFPLDSVIYQSTQPAHRPEALMALPPLGTTLRFIQARSFRRERKPGAGDFWIVLHDTEGHEGATAAEDGANFDAVRTDLTSTHRFCDRDSTIQCVEDEFISFAHSPVNDFGKALEICGKAARTAADWRDPPGRLEQVAWNVADWWKQKIDAGINPGPLRFFYAEDLVANMRQHGVTTHFEITRACGMPGQVQDFMRDTHQDPSTHTDPGRGFYPDVDHRDSIPDTPLGFVMNLANQLLAGTPTLLGDDDMRYKLFKPKGFFDVLAVGPGNPFNPGSPEAAQELVNQGQVADRAGNPVDPGTDFTKARIEISVQLWTAMNGGAPPIATKA
jgi:hypothetical protein